MSKTQMSQLIASSPSFARVLELFQAEVERMYADDECPPAELREALTSLDATIEAFTRLDEASR